MARRRRPNDRPDTPDPDRAHQAEHQRLREQAQALRAERERLRAKERELQAELHQLKAQQRRRVRRGGG